VSDLRSKAILISTASKDKELVEIKVKWEEWVRLYAGIDYPHEQDWMEIQRIFGGGIVAEGMT
jgi:hypothetical protein